MRPAARFLTGVAVLGTTVAPGVLAASPAWADTTVSSVLASNWYWQEQDNVTPPGAPAGLPVGAPDPASGIPAGDLGVSYQTQVDKVAALNFDITGLPARATVTRFAVTMKLDPAAQQLANGTPLLAACPAIDAFKPGDGPSPFSQVPPQGTSVCVEGKYDAGSTSYTFDVATIANDWAAGAPANGIVVQPKPGDNTVFNYAFLGAKDIKVQAEYVGAAPAAPAPAPAPPVDVAGVGSAVPPSGFTSGTPPLTPVDAAPVTAPAPQVLPPAAPPQVAAPAAPAAAVVPVDALRPNGLFWLSLLGVAALLVLAGLVLGDPMPAAAPDPRRRRFAEVVRARAAARADAASAVRPSAPRARPV